MRSTTLDIAHQVSADENWTDKEKTSLHAAAEEGNIEAVRSLLGRGVDINGRKADNEIPSHRVAAKGNVDVVRLLIERGAEVDSCGGWDSTPLHTTSLSDTSKSHGCSSTTAQM